MNKIHIFIGAFGALLLLSIVVCLWSASLGHAQLAEVEELPVGIRVTHGPSTVRAVEGGRSGYNYTWVHSTTVEATTILTQGDFVVSLPFPHHIDRLR